MLPDLPWYVYAMLLAPLGLLQNGASVKVWVNPDNPSQATLEPRTGFVWVLWLAAAAIWGVAYYAAVHG